MAYIQLEYDEPFCTFHHDDLFCDSCCTDLAGYENDCRSACVEEEERGVRVIYASCIHVDFRKKLKGLSVKKYEMETYYGDWTVPQCMLVTIQGHDYYCSKVTIDGECVWPEKEEAAADNA